MVYAGKVRDDAYRLVKQTLAIPRLEPSLYTEEEYERVKETLGRMTQEGIVLLSRS